MRFCHAGTGSKIAPNRVVLAIAVILSPFAAKADVKSDARSSLEMWSPSAVDFSDGTLTVSLSQNRVTEDMYIAALSFGICVGTLSGKDFSSVREFVLLNQGGTQGFVYERGATDCDAILDEDLRSIKDQRLHILGATHWH
ncbi:hypothetical protein SLH49_11560 [Cognatiyoonia sp. IB215446]|uniref:hypothetical protein n=1 Tax=Cognatiyoonia sp. IB215446 TaxID=3097355 RepID=UPI002A11376D|nr:hypothetical protein [Cognatiyoonia sp. IB215446]MDX8348621.1 hypothetical protein [Cognatiyoonia sp. IB215446]